MSKNVLVTGANGFVGRHVVRAALTKPPARVRLVYRGPDAPDGQEGVEAVRADLTDPASLKGLCEGIDAVVHCASLVDGDGQSLRRVNDLGTRALVDEALRHGVRRIVYVSTAAVYGRGPFRDAEPADLVQAPASATSRTRAAAERHVLAAGGTVLRPHLVYGTGDRWVLPGLAGLVRFLGAGVACPSVHSAVDVGMLAEVAVAAALREHGLPAVVHVNHPRPVPASALIDLVMEQLGLPGGKLLSPGRAGELAEGFPTALHHLGMLATDHWFGSDRVWRELGCDPGPAPADGLAAHLGWYGPLLRETAMTRSGPESRRAGTPPAAPARPGASA
ncbi:NAD-dependent epimerase/dehydratase family protein [Streptomyces sp. NPDC127066]|uniref:NAD-dependent epimerase/dehydratase family protein n=1 Tax=Streptomyces sp. NPDC127066 TaxID=3347125 RepID=UPI00365CFD5F